ncbi:MAG: ribosome biogenesis/translation initiation ATPase RLI [Nanoarchaeota archaeon]|nr:ribosome biogenesis/translation initiation ATPase RLI [Nanoarchaeota archaeon]MBU1643604.1 ribosome biogenesis/translation initiation ATPase RLI [Nanoarchaeota archaeon]MBU1976617.1 ribosome biogenesis/translation initiation ATPase RLI [Nanoarchaeota archaeon]
MKKRIAIIYREKCHPNECGNYLCAKLCPVNRTGSDCVTPGEDTKARIDELLCNGCGICPKRCPFGAIEIINLPATLNRPPIHRYGQNMFELYSLPTSLFGKVTGILGKNGIGKSTALRIMSNLLKPNLGNWQKEVDFKEIINYFKGTETQKFMEMLKDGKVSLSYKPQQVDLIPKQFHGTVRELLLRITSEEKVNKMAGRLQLADFLNNDLSKISGGELQKVAIAAAVLKEANIFMFDEPTSYLDIKQRINISKFIRNLADPATSTLVIEHDLIILDYMTDLVNIMYGNEGAFGIVSGVKNSREGINSFLDGYLKEENVRFRDHVIKYEKGQDTKGSSIVELTSWGKMSKKLGNFVLNAEEGKLHKNEVIGVLGENGIGKTSFIKILAGLIEPDSGELGNKVKVAYKPQYLETESEMLVSDFLEKAISKYTNQLINPLDLEKLFTQKLSELSGGQLQRVSIAHCLSQDADLFLLDEPSAYLDIEQRLLISKIVKNIAFERDLTIMIVDHDLMFLDYVSSKLIVFSGKPAKEGLLRGPFKMEEGMNLFLKSLDITLRRDPVSHRPRINKPDSVKDREQRKEGKLYY